MKEYLKGCSFLYSKIMR